MRKPAFQKVAAAMEIPADLAEKAALVELTGQNFLRVENYLGIIEYTAERLLLQCKNCRLEISGKNLLIELYAREELILRGQIEQLHYF